MGIGGTAICGIRMETAAHVALLLLTLFAHHASCDEILEDLLKEQQKLEPTCTDAIQDSIEVLTVDRGKAAIKNVVLDTMLPGYIMVKTGPRGSDLNVEVLKRTSDSLKSEVEVEMVLEEELETTRISVKQKAPVECFPKGSEGCAIVLTAGAAGASPGWWGSSLTALLLLSSSVRAAQHPVLSMGMIGLFLSSMLAFGAEDTTPTLSPCIAADIILTLPDEHDPDFVSETVAVELVTVTAVTSQMLITSFTRKFDLATHVGDIHVKADVGGFKGPFTLAGSTEVVMLDGFRLQRQRPMYECTMGCACDLGQPNPQTKECRSNQTCGVAWPSAAGEAACPEGHEQDERGDLWWFDPDEKAHDGKPCCPCQAGCVPFAPARDFTGGRAGSHLEGSHSLHAVSDSGETKLSLTSHFFEYHDESLEHRFR